MSCTLGNPLRRQGRTSGPSERPPEALSTVCGVRQRDLETVDRRSAPSDLSGATPEATGTPGHRTARDSLRSVATARTHDGTGRAALPLSTGRLRLPA